jgi:prolyl-tRNA synthetase
MGGSGSSEFMVESEIGDNTLILCKSCEYAANVEKAACKPDVGDASFTRLPQLCCGYSSAAVPPSCGGVAGGVLPAEGVAEEGSPCSRLAGWSEGETGALVPAPVPSPTLSAIEKISTPDVRTIPELCAFLKMDAKTFIKTLIYKAVNCEFETKKYDSLFVAVLIRGDLDVNETKLAAALKAAEVTLAEHADDERITGAPVGFAGPVGLKHIPLIADETVCAMSDAVTGALEADMHYKHVAIGRDFTPDLITDLRTVKAGDRCPVCGGELYEKKGNELGHIFKLGSKYTKSMNVSYLDVDGKAQTPIMGCYGIGLDRTLASVIEEHHDEAGIIWPVTLAPFHVEVIHVKYDGNAKAVADKIVSELEKSGVEVLLDDRNERAGVKFNDSDLIGIPYRVVVGDKGLALETPSVELKKRAKKDEPAELVPVVNITAKLAGLIADDMLALS